MFTNFTNDSELPGDYIFNRSDVRICLVLAYTFVFCCCFFGNLLVIIVIIFHRRMRTVTNFFLANLAFADLCVGIFCVYQNLSFYLTSRWYFGNGMCKMYHFVHSLSYTASIVILTVICVERYLAIVHPIWSKRYLTLGKLRVAIALVWLACAAYCCPRLVMYGTIDFPTDSGDSEELCILLRSLYDSKVYDLANFVVCFVIPLLVISVMYFIICLKLWRPPLSSRMKDTSNSVPFRSKNDVENECSFNDGGRVIGSRRRCEGSFVNPSKVKLVLKKSNEIRVENMNVGDYATRTIIHARRKVIRLLVVLVFTFAVCNLPFHARKFFQYWSPTYDGASSTSAIVTIVTTLVLFLNSGINPFLYAFFSDKFRGAMLDVLLCRIHRRPNLYRDGSFLSRKNERASETM